MNAFLNQLQNSENIEDQLVKQASVDLFAEVLEANNIDPEQLDDEQISALYNQVFSDSGEGEQEKLAEYQIYGEQMWEGFKGAMEKDAAAKEQAAKKGLSFLSGLGQRARDITGISDLKHAKQIAGGPLAKLKAVAGNDEAMKSVKSMPRFKNLSKQVSDARKFGYTRLGATGAAGLGALGGAGYGAHKAFGEKKAEDNALDSLALMRAREVLANVGVDPDTGDQYNQKLAGYESIQSDNPVLEEAVNQRALELLSENDYNVEAILENL